MRQKQSIFSLFLLSPSSRRAWIEIMTKLCEAAGLSSPSSRRAWIEIPVRHQDRCAAAVALLAEGVDRNPALIIARQAGAGRPPRGGRG